jgi:hypothetical protein
VGTLSRAACQAEKTAPQNGEPLAVADGGHVTLWYLTNALGRSIVLCNRLVKA